MAKWYHCGHAGCDYKHRHHAPLNLHRFRVHGIMSDKPKKETSHKCDRCDFSSHSAHGLILHLSKKHGIVSEARQKQKMNKLSRAGGELTIYPPQRSRSALRRIQPTTSRSGLPPGAWKFCPCCGTDLSEMAISMAAALTVTDGR
jgi:hypothetical protein